MANKLGIHDVIHRVFATKIGYQDHVGNDQQTLVANSTINNTTGVTSKNFGNPVTIKLLIHATVAATFAVWHSIDGVKFFHDTANDIVFAGAGDKTATIMGANFIQIIPTVNQTTGAYVIATGNY